MGISDIGSLAIMIAASRRMSPGVRPYLAAATVLTVTIDLRDEFERRWLHVVKAGDLASRATA